MSTRTASQENYKVLMIAIAIFAFLYGLSFGMNYVLIPVYFEDIGLSRTKISILATLEVLSILLIYPKLASLVQRFGTPKIIIICILLRFFAITTISNVKGFGYFMPVMLCLGAGGFTIMTLFQSWINTITTNKNRGFSLGAYNACTSLGIATGPLVLHATKNHTEIHFYLSAIVGVLAFISIFYVRKIMPKSAATNQLGHRRVVKTIPLAIFGGMIVDFSYFALIEFLVLYGIGHGLSHHDAGFLITAMLCGGILFDIPVGKLADIFERKKLMIFLACCSLVCSQVLHLVIHDKLLLVVVFAIWSASINGMFTCSLALIGDKFNENSMITAGSTFAMTSSVGGIMGLISVGSMMDLIGNNGLPYSIGIINAIFIIFTYFSKNSVIKNVK